MMFTWLDERQGALPLAGSEVSFSNSSNNDHGRRTSINKQVETIPKHVIIGDFELTNVM